MEHLPIHDSNITTFGGVGNGVADDTQALQLYLDACPAVRLPAGEWRTTAPLKVNSGNFIIGDGRETQFISDHNGAFLVGKDVSPEAGANVRRYNGGGRDFAAKGPGAAVAGSVGLDLRGCTMFKWSNVLITHFDKAIRQGDGYATFYNEFYGVDISDVVYGYHNMALANSCSVFGGRVNSSTVGTYDEGNSGNNYTGMAIEGFSDAAHRVVGGQFVRYLCSRIENNDTAIGIDINATSGATAVFAPQLTTVATPIRDLSPSSTIIADSIYVLFGGTRIRRHLSVSGPLDFPSVAAGSSVDRLIALAGATVGDSVFATPNASLPGGLMVMAIPATNGVYVRLVNVTGSAIDLGEMTFRVDAWQH